MIPIRDHHLGAKYRRYRWNVTRRLDDWKGVVHCQRVSGCVRTIRADPKTWVFLMESRVVADEQLLTLG